MRRKPQETADFRRKPQIFAGNRRFLQKPVSPIRCLRFGALLKFFKPIKENHIKEFGGGNAPEASRG